MSTPDLFLPAHPEGEGSLSEQSLLPVETFGGRIHVEWDPQAAVTPLGQLSFFIEFLKTAELFEPWVADCPLRYASPNAPLKRDVLGTTLLSVLSGHKRYAHITSLRSDTVNPPLLGMNKVVSEDSVRRAFGSVDEAACVAWQRNHLRRCYEPLLYEPWILDIDTTVKPLYGHQQGAKVGYNPHKPGRPSHVYHTYFIANLRLVLDVEVQPGNQSASSYSRPALFAFFDSLPPSARPAFLRGDIGFGNEGTMQEAEQRAAHYLFKLRQTKKVTRLIEEVFGRADWVDAGQGWQGVEDTLKLSGWSRARRVIVLRRELRDELVLERQSDAGQLEMAFIETLDPVKKYEYAVYVTSLDDEILTVAQHYRDRGDAENPFDELKNQWGWAGYTTRDLKRCQIMARHIALIYNWWSLFARLAIPDKHAEAITSRPLLLHAVGKQTRHAGQIRLTLTSMHGKASRIRKILSYLTTFFRAIRQTAEQLDWASRWRIILSRIFIQFLRGRLLRSPKLIEGEP
jgi:hypothetical protein